MPHNDQELLRRLVAGDHLALGELYDRYGERVYHLSLLHTQQESVAEEITQDVFLELHQSAEKFRGEAGIFTWLYRVTVNRCRDWQRRRSAAKRSVWKNVRRIDVESSSENIIADFDHPGIQLERREEARALFGAIHRLPERQKTAFLLCFVEQLPRRQAAAIMQLTEKALESLLQRAKAGLRKMLADRDPRRRK